MTKKTAKKETNHETIDETVEVPVSERASVNLAFLKYQDSCCAHSEMIRQNRQKESALEAQSNQLARDFNGRVEAAMEVAGIKQGDYLFDPREMVFKVNRVRR